MKHDTGKKKKKKKKKKKNIDYKTQNKVSENKSETAHYLVLRLLEFV